jgi:hypothetical protein
MVWDASYWDAVATGTDTDAASAALKIEAGMLEHLRRELLSRRTKVRVSMPDRTVFVLINGLEEEARAGVRRRELQRAEQQREAVRAAESTARQGSARKRVAPAWMKADFLDADTAMALARQSRVAAGSGATVSTVSADPAVGTDGKSPLSPAASGVSVDSEAAADAPTPSAAEPDAPAATSMSPTAAATVAPAASSARSRRRDRNDVPADAPFALRFVDVAALVPVPHMLSLTAEDMAVLEAAPVAAAKGDAAAGEDGAAAGSNLALSAPTSATPTAPRPRRAGIGAASVLMSASAESRSTSSTGAFSRRVASRSFVDDLSSKSMPSSASAKRKGVAGSSQATEATAASVRSAPSHEDKGFACTCFDDCDAPHAGFTADDAYEYFLRREWRPPCLMDEEGQRGRCIRAGCFIPKHCFVTEYAGQIVSDDEINKRNAAYEEEGLGSYVFYVRHNDAPHAIDATAERVEFGIGRLLNHSRKAPNCQVRNVIIDGIPRLAMVAKRDIHYSDELSYDYGENDKRVLKAFSWLATS